jgi:hypothetical protein
MTTTQPTTRVEITGNIIVHYPIKPATVHTTARAFQVACA